MPKELATLLCLVFVAWLFLTERKARPKVSGALWLPLIWLIIISSRPVSFWVGGGFEVETVDDYLDGSPLDRNIFLALILCGVGVLARRPVPWGELMRSNAWLAAFFLYWGLSSLWSDYSFVAFKRWVKDLGNVVMVLVILTDRNPMQAIRTVFARAGFVLIPFSVLFIKYYPDYGRVYNQWTWEVMFTGVATEKNALGSVAMVCGMFVLYDLIGEKRTRPLYPHQKRMKWAQVLILLMVLWLFKKAESSTALVCMVLGGAILIALRTEWGLRQMRHLKAYACLAGAGILLLVSVPGLLDGLVGMLGEDVTLTGRTEIWADVLSEPINPLLGTGYHSFWLGDRVEHYWEKWYFRPNQAHNGYIETYINGGLIALGLLLAIIVLMGMRLKKEVLLRRPCASLFFTLLVLAVLYNWTEAVYNRLSPVWMVFLLVALRPKRLPRRVGQTASATKGGETGSPPLTESVPASA